MKILACSPHMDDAFISVGGSVAAWSDAGHEVTVLDLFGWDPFTILGDGSEAERVATRRSEERTNAGLAAVELEIWEYTAGWPGRGYRTWDEERQRAADEPLVNAIAARLARLLVERRYDIVLVPASVGGHIDHRIVSAVGVEMAGAGGGVQMALYEDLPYALDAACWKRPGPLAQPHWVPVCVDISGTWELKRIMLSTYRSQLRLDEQAMVHEYAAAPDKYLPQDLAERALLCPAGPHPRERLWVAPPGPADAAGRSRLEALCRH